MIEIQDTAPADTPDVYFTAEYGRAEAQFRGGQWHSISDSLGAWQLPVITMRTGDDNEALSPYGYSGIHVSPAWSPGEAIESWNASRRLLADLQVVSLFLRFSPLDPHSTSVAQDLPELEMVRSGRTYVNSISHPDSMWSAMEGRARTSIRKARNVGMTARVRWPAPEDLRADQPFRALYESTMARVGAGSQYRFGDSYFEALLQIPTSPLNLVEILVGERVVAASLVMRHGKVAHYHLSGSDPAAARSGANSLLVWSILEWCSENGVETCHLGGGLSDDDGLAKFKRSFAGSSVDFFTGRAVIDQDRYDWLTRTRAASLGVPVETLERSGYFPAFRADA